jgi:hypothetical protein
VQPDRSPSLFRRVLHYVGLANAPDTRFNQRAVAPKARPDPPELVSHDQREPRAEAFGRALRTGLVYFGLAEDEEGHRTVGRSRYGDVGSALDDDIDALRTRVAELERRLSELAADRRP